MTEKAADQFRPMMQGDWKVGAFVAGARRQGPSGLSWINYLFEVVAVAWPKVACRAVIAPSGHTELRQFDAPKNDEWLLASDAYVQACLATIGEKAHDTAQSARQKG